MCKGPEAEVGLVWHSWEEAGPELRGGLDASVSLLGRPRGYGSWSAATPIVFIFISLGLLHLLLLPH